jgi:hypothetical protein
MPFSWGSVTLTVWPSQVKVYHHSQQCPNGVLVTRPLPPIWGKSKSHAGAALLWDWPPDPLLLENKGVLTDPEVFESWNRGVCV